MPTPELSSRVGGRSFSASGFSGPSVTFIQNLSEFPDVVRRRSATAPYDARAGIEQLRDSSGHLFGRLLIYNFQILEDRGSGIRLSHDRQTGNRAISPHSVRCELHIDTGTAIERENIATVFDHEFCSHFRTGPHHGANLIAFNHSIESHGANH